MDRCALFVDAGYALADGAMAVHGTRRRDCVSWDHAGLLKLLAGLARDRTGLPVLRCYWYETADGRTTEHDALAEMPGLKLRLTSGPSGQGKGIESQVRRDLVTLAKSGAISDAFIASANDHLAELVSEVQDLGLRVVVLHIDADSGWTIPQPLRQECDDIVEISGVHLRPFVDLIRGAEPSLAHELPQRNANVVTAGDDSSVNEVPSRTARPVEAVPVAAGAYQAAEARGAHHAAHAAGVQSGNPYAPRSGDLVQAGAGPVAGAGNGAARGGSQPAGAHAAKSEHFAAPEVTRAAAGWPGDSGQFPVVPDLGQADAGRPGNSGQFPVVPDLAQADAGRPGNSGQFPVLDSAQAGAVEANSAQAGARGRPGNSGQFAAVPSAAGEPGAGNSGQFAVVPSAAGEPGAGNSGQFPVLSPSTPGVDQTRPPVNGPAPYAAAQGGNSYGRGANGSGVNGSAANGGAVNGARNGGFASGSASDTPPVAGGATGIYGRPGGDGRSVRPQFATGPQQVVPAPSDGAMRNHSAPADRRAPSVPASYQVPAPSAGPLAGAGQGRPQGVSWPNGGSGYPQDPARNGAVQNGSVPGQGSRDGGGFRVAPYRGAQVNAASAGSHSANGGLGTPRPGSALNDGIPNGGVANGPIPNGGVPNGQSNGAAQNGARNGGGPNVGQHAPQQYQQIPRQQQNHYRPQPGPAVPAVRPAQPVAVSLADAVNAAHSEGFSFGESVGRDAPGLWLEAVLARKPRMPSDLEARLLQGSALPIDSLLHDEVRHSLRRGFWDALESANR